MRELGIVFIIVGLMTLLMIAMIMIAIHFNLIMALFFLALVLLVAGIIIYLKTD